MNIIRGGESSIIQFPTICIALVAAYRCFLFRDQSETTASNRGLSTLMRPCRVHSSEGSSLSLNCKPLDSHVALCHTVDLVQVSRSSICGQTKKALAYSYQEAAPLYVLHSMWSHGSTLCKQQKITRPVFLLNSFCATLCRNWK